MKTPSKSCRGFSLVEVMVGMIIGLLGIIVIFQVFAVSEGYKRTTTSGGDAQQSGALAVFSMERDLRMAGYGINTTALMGCTVNAYNAGLPAPGTFSFQLVPVVITPGAGTTPDSITVTYGSSDLTMAPTQLTQNMPSPSSTFKVANRFGVQPGDLVIAAEPGKPCTLAEVTNVPGTPGQTDNVIHNNGTYTSANGQTVNASYNYPSGLGTSYTTNGSLFDIGSTPINNTYSIDSRGELVRTTNLGTGGATPIADGIVQLRAQYGMDDGVNNGTVNHSTYVASDGIVDRYTNAAPANWTQVIAVRFALVARSGLMEKPNPTTGVCDTTTASPAWNGGTLDLSADPNWQCYRYKTFQTTVPLRNMIWLPQ